MDDLSNTQSLCHIDDGVNAAEVPIENVLFAPVFELGLHPLSGGEGVDDIDSGGCLREQCLVADISLEIGAVVIVLAARVRDEVMTVLSNRYEAELMNPMEALALGSVSKVVMPGNSRRVLAQNLDFLMRNYTPSAMSGIQREFE